MFLPVGGGGGGSVLREGTSAGILSTVTGSYGTSHCGGGVAGPEEGCGFPLGMPVGSRAPGNEFCLCPYLRHGSSPLTSRLCREGSSLRCPLSACLALFPFRVMACDTAFRVQRALLWRHLKCPQQSDVFLFLFLTQQKMP